MSNLELNQTIISIVILSDNHGAAKHLEEELEHIDHSISWKISVADFTAVHSVHADFVIIEITNDSNIEFFIQAAEYLKNEEAIAHIITIVEGRESINAVSKIENQFLTDEMIYAPYNIVELTKIIKTHAVSLIISNQMSKTNLQSSLGPRLTFGKILVENEVITEEQLQKALEYQKETK